jgi:CHASE2 domain-containing sensor protein
MARSLNISVDPSSFAILAEWPTARLEEVGRAMVEADGKEVSRERVLSYLAILESDLQGLHPERAARNVRRAERRKKP